VGHVSDPPALTGSSHGTAVCGPACTVVWEGRSREASPYPDWLFLALLLGAFCSSYAATLGGRQRDRVQHI